MDITDNEDLASLRVHQSRQPVFPTEAKLQSTITPLLKDLDKDLMRDIGKKSGVRAPGVGDEHGAQILERGLEACAFLLKLHRC